MDVGKKRVVVFVKRWGYVPVVVIYCGALAAALTTPLVGGARGGVGSTDRGLRRSG